MQSSGGGTCDNLGGGGIKIMGNLDHEAML